MKNYLSSKDIPSLTALVDEAIALKQHPFAFEQLGKRKTLAMLFFNPSLRTRLSTQKAALNLGMHVIVMNVANDGWVLEFEDGAIMEGSTAEHVREAAMVISQYCDVLAIRAFAGLKDRQDDYSEKVIAAFVKYATVPVISLESATGHPLQALADAITIKEYQKVNRPKVVLTWAPHPRALPQAVANSFVEFIKQTEAELVVTHPEGYELDPDVMNEVTVEYDQKKAFLGADFIYAKNWSSFTEYGQILTIDKKWMVTGEKMKLTRNAKFMHCLPVRRNVVVADEVLDNENSIVIPQANNRTYAAQIVLKKILENG